MKKASWSQAMPRLWSVRFWQELFIYFFVFSIAGTLFEVSWTTFFHICFGRSLTLPIMQTVIPQAAPYGLGIVAIILITMPLMKQYKLHPTAVFLLNIGVTTVVEYICALVVVLIYGQNSYWNYSALPLNYHGYISLGSSIVFAVLAMIFIYYIYPFCEKFLRPLKARQIRITFWVLFVIYVVNLAASFL